MHAQLLVFIIRSSYQLSRYLMVPIQSETYRRYMEYFVKRDTKEMPPFEMISKFILLQSVTLV